MRPLVVAVAGVLVANGLDTATGLQIRRTLSTGAQACSRRVDANRSALRMLLAGDALVSLIWTNLSQARSAARRCCTCLNQLDAVA